MAKPDLYDTFAMINDHPIAADVDARIINCVFRAMDAHQRAADTVTSEAKEVADKVSRVARYVAEGQTVNSLGELQGRGPSFDVACAVYATTAVALRSVVVLLPEALHPIVWSPFHTDEEVTA